MLVLKDRAGAAVASGACVIYTTQIIEIAERFSDRLLVLDYGRIVMDFSAQALRAMPAEGPQSLEQRLAAYRERR